MSARAHPKQKLLPWLALLALLLFVAAVRIRLASVPLERDEGEYAYAGQLILRGVPPYQLAYNMKFPGTYYAYALILGLFGQSPTGIHLGLLVVNAASIVLLFQIARRLFGDAGALVASLCFALLTLDRYIMGVFAHATHFVLLCALGGLLLLLRGDKARDPRRLLASGALFGASILMKQHAVLLLPVAAALAWLRDGDEEPGIAPAARRAGALALGVLLPFAAVATLFAAQGVLGKAWFWTFRYAKEYVTLLPLSAAPSQLIEGLKSVTETTLPFWALAGAGFLALAVDRYERRTRIFVLGLAGASFLASCPGFFFRQHYFIPLLAPLALASAAAWNSGARLLARFLPAGTARLLATATVALVASSYVATERDYLFTMTTRELSRTRYGSNPFIEAQEIARYIAAKTTPDDRIAVLGSEPEIYFYTRLTSASGYIYAYPLMEQQAYATTMQQEMMREIEAAHPKYLVFVQISASWLVGPKSDRTIFDWGNRYSARCYTLVGIADIHAKERSELLWDDAVRGYKKQSDNLVYTFRRNGDAPCTAQQ